MADLITKVFVTSGLLGGVGGLGYAVTYYLSGYTLGDTLKDKGHDLLNYEMGNTSDKSDWENILKAYSDNDEELKGKKIKLTGNQATIENINELKKLCANATSSKKYDKKTSELTEQYCVKPVTIIELLRKNKDKRILGWSIDDNNSDNGIWDARVAEYKGLATSEKIDALNLNPSDSGSQKTNRDALKKWCQGFEGSRTHNKYYHTKYGQFIRWCVV